MIYDDRTGRSSAQSAPSQRTSCCAWRYVQRFPSSTRPPPIPRFPRPIFRGTSPTCRTTACRLYSGQAHLHELGLKRVGILRREQSLWQDGRSQVPRRFAAAGPPGGHRAEVHAGDTDFARQLQVIRGSRVDAIVLWADEIESGPDSEADAGDGDEATRSLVRIAPLARTAARPRQATQPRDLKRCFLRPHTQ